ncbi:hypothetical protein DFS34DRAFT_584321 [Phlyctochytrium arcticum]|nr:hypothetical protein DFS34DRAFT_584321 [Phlyctochytrium arcticum]
MTQNEHTTEELSEAVKNLSINEPTEGQTGVKKPRKRNRKAPVDAAAANNEATGTTEEGEAQEAPVEFDNTAKVFVGNLSFNTTKEELTDFFAKAGKIASVNLITRGQRSLGYGFIAFESDADADQAVELLDKAELGDRNINVERAQDKVPGESRGGARGRGGRRGRGAGRGRGRGSRAPKENGVVCERYVYNSRILAPRVRYSHIFMHTGEVTEEGAERGTRGGRRGRGRRAREPREPREPRERTGETSKTTLFVANLPFKVTDEDLSSIFKDFNVTSAHVVKLRSGRSKGFGFVEVADEEEQQKVLNELKNIVVDDRELVIKVAMAFQTAPSGEADQEIKTEIKQESE